MNFRHDLDHFDFLLLLYAIEGEWYSWAVAAVSIRWMHIKSKYHWPSVGWISLRLSTILVYICELIRALICARLYASNLWSRQLVNHQFCTVVYSEYLHPDVPIGACVVWFACKSLGFDWILDQGTWGRGRLYWPQMMDIFNVNCSVRSRQIRFSGDLRTAESDIIWLEVFGMTVNGGGLENTGQWWGLQLLGIIAVFTDVLLRTKSKLGDHRIRWPTGSLSEALEKSFWGAI